MRRVHWFLDKAIWRGSGTNNGAVESPVAYWYCEKSGCLQPVKKAWIVTEKSETKIFQICMFLLVSLDIVWAWICQVKGRGWIWQPLVHDTLHKMGPSTGETIKAHGDQQPQAKRENALNMFKARLYGAMRHGTSWDPRLMVAWIIKPWKGIQIISRVEPKRWVGEDGFGGVDLGISENRWYYLIIYQYIPSKSEDFYGKL